MSIICHRYKLVYYDVPKVACTSLKMLFWSLETGNPMPEDLEQQAQSETAPADRFRRLLRGGKSKPQAPAPYRVHDQPELRTLSYRRAAPVPQGYATLVVVRDPIARLHSAWKNRLTRKVLCKGHGEEDLLNEGLALAPGFGEFIDNFDAYRMVSRSARVHSLPYAWHLGPGIERFDHIFAFEDLDPLIGFLSERTGTDLVLPRRNPSETRSETDELTSAQADRLLEITRPDYDWLGGMYDAEDSIRRYRPDAARRNDPPARSDPGPAE